MPLEALPALFSIRGYTKKREKHMIELILEGPMAGQTINLLGHQFVDGKLALEGTYKDNATCALVLKRCYQAKVVGDVHDAMTTASTTKLVLRGPLAGQTINLGGHQFTKGVMVVSGSPDSNYGLIKVCHKSWQAELDLGDQNGQREVHTDRPGEVPSGVRPDREGSTEEAPLDVGGHDDSEAGDGPGLQAEGDGDREPSVVAGEEVAKAALPGKPEADERVLAAAVKAAAAQPDADADVPLAKDDPEPEPVENDTTTELREVLADLDPDQDNHWNKSGAPAVKAVKLRLGVDLPAAEIKAAWPEFNRDFARGLPVD